VIEVKFESLRGGWCSLEVVGPYGVSVWKYIRRGWDMFYKFVRLEVGDGYNVWFWHDLWYGDSPLKLCCPILFSIARFKDTWLVDNLYVLNGVAHWNVIFTCLARNVLNTLFLWVSAHHSPSRVTFAKFLISCFFVSSF
jgi:hypothetical protein